MSINQDEFKQALRRWASGVTVVTTKTADDQPAGMTVSSFSSVSAEPPLVLVCINADSSNAEAIMESGVFAVNILETDQADLSGAFASSKTHEERFREIAWSEGVSGAPLLDGCTANLDCALVQKVQAGSHWVFVGEVQAVRSQDGAPLLYFDGGYRKLQA
ncbi:MAG: flavin reductase family protein [Deltaproteobacteria bacterium]|nr:flavin reductase family protein [Deltaproteobacteria bacterium]